MFERSRSSTWCQLIDTVLISQRVEALRGRHLLMLGLFRWREFVSHSLHEAGSSASGGTLQQCWRPAPGCRAKHFHLITDGSVERTVRSRANSGGMAVGQQVTWLAGRQWSSGRGGFAERRGDGGRVFFQQFAHDTDSFGVFLVGRARANIPIGIGKGSSCLDLAQVGRIVERWMRQRRLENTRALVLETA